MDVGIDEMWEDAVSRLAGVLADVRIGRFLLVEYEVASAWDPTPYAQCAPESDSWYLEVVSQNYLPADRWPIDELALRRAGWMLPDDETANWWRCAESPEEAALLLLSALRHGRLCPDVTALRWSVGVFPSGPDGGEPLPVLEWEVELQAA